MLAFKTEKLSEALGVSPRRIRQLRADGILKEAKPGSGLYEPVENVRAYIDYIKKAQAGSEECDYYSERAALTRAKRKTYELEFRKRDGELHEGADIERVISQMIIKFKSRLLSIPSKLSPVLAQEDSKENVYAVLKQHIDEALSELSNYDELFGNEDTIEENEEENRKVDEENTS